MKQLNKKTLSKLTEIGTEIKIISTEINLYTTEISI
jgi:hypothetical protein